MLPSAAELVAKFLRTNGYTETLSSFIKEAGLSPDFGSDSTSHITIEQILQEKKTFDLSLNFEKLGVKEDLGWTTVAPTKPTVVECISTRSNILSIAVLDLQLAMRTGPSQYIAVSTADRRLHLMDPTSEPVSLIRSYACFQDSPILDILAIESRYLLIASMSGKLLLYDTVSDKILDERKDHSKYLVKLTSWKEAHSTVVASAGWDSKIHLYRIVDDGSHGPRLGEPLATITLPSIPETILFIQSPENGQSVLVLGRRDSTFLYYYAIPLSDSDAPEILLLGKQNLAPHANAWISFSPADIQVSPTDPSIVAVATSSTPHMKLLVVKLLLPPAQPPSLSAGFGPDPRETVTQASQARADLLIQDREEAAISVNVSTLAPQTAYSTPRLTWRPDGSGIYVSSDDGIVRGIEASTGKLVTNLEGHEAGSKLRCLWAGRLRRTRGDASNSALGDELLISGGFDQRLILWTP